MEKTAKQIAEELLVAVSEIEINKMLRSLTLPFRNTNLK